MVLYVFLMIFLGMRRKEILGYESLELLYLNAKKINGKNVNL